jgi:hypothetical protein
MVSPHHIGGRTVTAAATAFGMQLRQCLVHGRDNRLGMRHLVFAKIILSLGNQPSPKLSCRRCISIMLLASLLLRAQQIMIEFANGLDRLCPRREPLLAHLDSARP